MSRPHGSDIMIAVGLAVAMVLVSLPAPTGTTTGPGVPGIPGATGGPWGGWATVTLDEHVSGTETDVQLTPEGEPRFLYAKGYNGAFVAHPTPTGWQTSFIEGKVGMGGLAIADNGTESVVYSVVQPGTQPSDIRLATRASPQASWAIETVEVGVYPDIALASSGEVHMVYRHSPQDPAYVRHAVRHLNGSYTVESIVETPTIDAPSMAIDSQDRVHVAWGDKNGSDYTVRYAVQDPNTGTWSLTWLDDCGSEIDGPSLAVDSNDVPHVACYAEGKGLGYYHVNATGQWMFETVADGDDVTPIRLDWDLGLDPAITIGPRDEPHITFRTDFNPSFPDDPLSPAHLYYATLTAAGVWSVEMVDGSGTGVGWASSVTTNSLGQPLVGYVVEWITFSGPCQPECSPARLAHPVDYAPSLVPSVP